jgi:hypothetical protein
MTARDKLNVLKQHHNLDIIYSSSVSGPEHAQIWTGSWKLDAVEIGRAVSTTKVGAKEESARIAIQSLFQVGYHLLTSSW